MKSRPLGRTGLIVSEIGFGAWGIGGRTAGETSYGATDDARSRAALERAFALGITFYDTSNVYGDGHSEALLGEVFAHRRERVVIATKAGLSRYDAPPDFSPEALRRSLDESLARLRTRYVDLLQLHNPPPDLFRRRPESYAALEGLVRDGKIRSFGVSVKAPDEALAMLEGHFVPAVQVNFNMLDIRALDSGLIERAGAAGVGVIARTPLSFGFLSGAVTRETRFPEGDHRRRWPRRQIERWIEGAVALHEAARQGPAEPPSQVALRFCLSFPGISTVIPGILSPEEAEEDARASALGALPEAARERVVALNRRESFFIGG